MTFSKEGSAMDLAGMQELWAKHALGGSRGAGFSVRGG